MTKRKWYYALVLLQVLFLATMSASYYAMDIWGKEITLRTEPIDPRDPFYGDYIRLEYEVETIPEDRWKVEEELKEGERVFLILRDSGEGIYELDRATTMWPETEEAVVLQAKYERYDSGSSNYHVDIGLSRYHVQENTGLLLERRETLFVDIVLAPWKQKKISEVK
ncbi:GDYXXLXY domain-containing protein [Halobacillus sp. KGW1]|uniref:GDYXXLXY domain-containing protein n=1 Tax=Halobacillus sp. KGW1 TaxID=1793726 RepID=UPI000782DB1F|nr:GDYXXLXY domain-containing protein [Halobacillus sp. KGW1]